MIFYFSKCCFNVSLCRTRCEFGVACSGVLKFENYEKKKYKIWGKIFWQTGWKGLRHWRSDLTRSLSKDRVMSDLEFWVLPLGCNVNLLLWWILSSIYLKLWFSFQLTYGKTCNDQTILTANHSYYIITYLVEMCMCNERPKNFLFIDLYNYINLHNFCLIIC